MALLCEDMKESYDTYGMSHTGGIDLAAAV